jgi:tetratricopeptide (TPR) repeat protein
MDIFNSVNARPNAVHYLLAHELLDDRTSIWTTNYDTLIEEALESLAPDGASRDRARARLHKPHGSFRRNERGKWDSAKGLLFAAPGVVRSWAGGWTTGLKNEMARAEVTLVGYSGIDVNAYRPLRAALEGASSVTWYLTPASGAEDPSADVLFRFPRLTNENLVLDANPSRAFIDRVGNSFDTVSMDLFEGHEARAERIELAFDDGVMTRAVARPRVQARVALEMGERKLGYSILLESIEEGLHNSRAVPTMIRHAPFARHLRARFRRFLRQTRLPLPVPQRLRAQSVTDLPLYSRADADRLIDQMERWEPTTSDPLARSRLLLARATTLRFCGRYSDAIQDAYQARDCAIGAEPPLTTEAARTEFELIEAFRCQGRFEEALDEIRSRIHALGMSHWSAWTDYELACLHLQLRHPVEAQQALAKAQSFFHSISGTETAYNARPGKRFTHLASAVLARANGDPTLCEAFLTEIQGDTQAMTLPLYRSIVSFQFAEMARLRRMWDVARDNYEKMADDIEIHGGLRYLGTALCAWATQADTQPSLEKATHAFSQQKSIFGLAYCLRLARELKVSTSTVIEPSTALHIPAADAAMFSEEEWPTDPTSQVLFL